MSDRFKVDLVIDPKRGPFEKMIWRVTGLRFINGVEMYITAVCEECHEHLIPEMKEKISAGFDLEEANQAKALGER